MTAKQMKRKDSCVARVIGLAAVVAATVTPADAAIDGLQAFGVVASIDEGTIPGFASMSGLTIGDAATTSILYDDAIPDSSPSINISVFESPFTDVSGGVGPFGITGGSPFGAQGIVYVSNAPLAGLGGDHVYYQFAPISPAFNGLTLRLSYLQFSDGTNNAWPAGGQPTTLTPNPLFDGFDYDNVLWRLTFEDTSGGIASVFVDLQDLQAIPEPASLALLCLGGLAVLRRRR